MISLVWSRSNKIGSRIIRWGYGGQSSHFAIVMDNRIVFHSHFGGTGLLWLQEFYEIGNEAVFWINLDWLTLGEEELVYQRILSSKRSRGYDWPALLYLSFKGIMAKITGNRMIVGENPWADEKRELCVELAEVLSVVGFPLKIYSNVMPDHLYEILHDAACGLRKRAIGG